MDFLLVGICALFGLISYLMVGLTRHPPVAFHFFAWGIAIPWLTVAAVYQLFKANAYHITEWTGLASLDVGSYILAALGVTILANGFGERGKNVSSDDSERV